MTATSVPTYGVAEYRRHTVSILIPTLNEAATIAGVLQSIPSAFARAVLIVDGGSTDATVATATALGFPVIRQDGTGLGNAIRVGVQATTGEIIVTLDADGAHDGRLILQLLDRLSSGYDLVVASRVSAVPDSVGMFSRRRQSTEPRGVVRDFGNRFFTWACRALVGVPIHDVLNGFKAGTREVFTQSQWRDGGQTHDLELVMAVHDAGWRIGELAITQAPRQGGHSKLHPFRDGAAMLVVLAAHLVRRRRRARVRGEAQARWGVASATVPAPRAPDERVRH